MEKPKQVQIKPAKGRPMLTWVGKRPLRRVTAYPAQLVEAYSPPGAEAAAGAAGRWSDWPEGFPRAGLLFHGDNKDVLASLLANGFRGKVNLIYIDPPFDSGADYVRKVTLRGASGTAKLEGESYTLGEQIQYTDIWANDNYLQFMYERLLLLNGLLAEDGLLFVHLDPNRAHYVRVLLDEVMGESNYVNEVIWQQTSAHNDPGRFGRIHNNILVYRKSGVAEIATRLGTRSQSYVENWFKYALGPRGDVITIRKGESPPQGHRRFRLSDLRSPHPRPNLMYKYIRIRTPPQRLGSHTREDERIRRTGSPALPIRSGRSDHAVQLP
jgi:adenine-specific DNA-methyltransferase